MAHNLKRWFFVSTSRYRLGNVYCTEAELRRALGPYVRIEPNGAVTIYGAPRS